MFNQVSIIGCGLIGSSVLRCLKKNKSVKKIVSFDKNKSVNDLIKKNNLSDQVAANLRDAVTNSDLVLIATPLSSFESVIDSIKDNLKQGSILTDTCSVKKVLIKSSVIKKLKDLLGFQDTPLQEQKIVDQMQALLIYLKIDGPYFLQKKILKIQKLKKFLFFGSQWEVRLK